jgi:hypothetical protein
VEQNEFVCARQAESFSDLSPSQLFEVITRDRDCEAASSPAPGADADEHATVVTLPAWLKMAIILTLILAAIAAGTGVWQLLR